MPSPLPTDAPRSSDAPQDPGRRRLLAFGAGATAVSVSALGAARAIESPEAQVEMRYSRTPHVERYYDLNRL